MFFLSYRASQPFKINRTMIKSDQLTEGVCSTGTMIKCDHDVDPKQQWNDDQGSIKPLHCSAI
ncbi:hypothetical protein AS132_21295 [Photobacterium sanguinicancri]|nr:hypothetical protein AS132_21295 [Photobacterium sanguinicancri]